MTNILLTGAGFSRNWGAWLATEAFEYLLGSEEIDASLRRELWLDKNKGLGFEATLGRLQQAANSDPTGNIASRANTLASALVGMFNLMDQGLKAQQFEFQEYRQFQITTFLQHFDAIFTLNQDLLLERHYASNVMLADNRRWSGFGSPGIGAPLPGSYYDRDLSISAHRSPLSQGNFLVSHGTQPYFKLHGSANWYDSIGAGLLVMGGNKTAAIGANALLKWYAEQFDQYLQGPDARLMIIGYGFRDPHINEAIMAGCKRNLLVFIVDPAGTDILDQRDASAQITQPPDDLMESIQPRLVGASRRPLSTTFGGDIVEHSRLMGFFRS